MKLQKEAIKNASLTTLYIILVASFMFYAQNAKLGMKNQTILIPITILLLFVTSAAITGYLIFGKPVIFYLDGKKKEALNLLLQTLISLTILTIIGILTLIFLG